MSRRSPLLLLLSGVLIITGCAWSRSQQKSPNLSENAQTERSMALATPASSTTRSAQGELPAELAFARLSERQGEAEEAARLYRHFLQSKGEHPLPYHRLGVIAAGEGRLEEAESHLRQSLAFGNPPVELLSDFGYVLYLRGNFPEAERFLQSALRMAPDHPATCNNLGMLYGAMGRFEESFAYFRRVNSDAEAHANLGFVFSQHGDLERARTHYLEALTLNRNLRPAAKALLQIEELRNARIIAAARRQQELEQVAAAQHGTAADPLLTPIQVPDQGRGYPESGPIGPYSSRGEAAGVQSASFEPNTGYPGAVYVGDARNTVGPALGTWNDAERNSPDFREAGVGPGSYR